LEDGVPRNKKLELENIAPGCWRTADRRFAIIREVLPTDPMRVTQDWKIRQSYAIYDLRAYDGPIEYPQFAPRVGMVQTHREIYPWLGKFTGEGSFERGNPDLVKPKAPGGTSIHESFFVAGSCKDVVAAYQLYKVLVG
jgi:hypothetical protein